MYGCDIKLWIMGYCSRCRVVFVCIFGMVEILLVVVVDYVLSLLLGMMDIKLVVLDLIFIKLLLLRVVLLFIFGEL